MKTLIGMTCLVAFAMLAACRTTGSTSNLKGDEAVTGGANHAVDGNVLSLQFEGDAAIEMFQYLDNATMTGDGTPGSVIGRKGNAISCTFRAIPQAKCGLWMDRQGRIRAKDPIGENFGAFSSVVTTRKMVNYGSRCVGFEGATAESIWNHMSLVPVENPPPGVVGGTATRQSLDTACTHTQGVAPGLGYRCTVAFSSSGDASLLVWPSECIDGVM